MKRLSKSGIEYLTHSWGIWSGCHNWRNGVCGGGSDFNCWAKSLATRFKNIYPNGFEPTYYPGAIDSPKYLKEPSRIGVGWVGDVIGYASPAVRIAICDAIKQCPQHTFLFLTKNPDKLREWDFPDNSYVGQSITQCLDGIGFMADVEAKVKFISFEPLLFYNVVSLTASELFRVNGISWVIIGAQSKPTVYPKIEWVQEIVEAADKAGIPVFLKNNLKPLITSTPLGQCTGLWAEGFKLRQEIPHA